MKQMQQKIREKAVELMTQLDRAIEEKGIPRKGIGKPRLETLMSLIGRYFISGAEWAIRHQWNCTSTDCMPAEDEYILMNISGKMEVGKGRDLRAKGAQFWMAIPNVR